MRSHFKLSVFASFVLLSGLVSACNTAGAPGSTTQDSDASVLSRITGKASKFGQSCHSDDPNHLCLGVKIVSYRVHGVPVTSQSLAVRNIAAINQVWGQCQIGFQIDKYQAVTPADYALPTGGESQNITNQIRQTFEENNTLLLVSTDPWPGTVKNAWTNMPKDAPYGVVYEGSVANFPNIIAHELGHYLGLTHSAESPESLPANLMNWLIYPHSNEITPEQCSIAQQSARGIWQPMLR